MEALLSNEFVVLALDALLHVASVFVLGIIVIIACKLLTKGFVDAKLLTGLIIAMLLVAMRVFLLNNVHHLLAGADIIIVMAAVGFVLFLTSLVLVYKLVSIPLLGTILSSIVIVAAQLALAHYTPVLSLKLMPEGQRFAEYAGVSNEKTKQLVAQAKNFQGESKHNIGRVLKEALGTLAFWSSEEQQEILSKDLASGVEFIQERRAFMESMSEDELAEYRAAMGSFMQEQGIDLDNRYSLENLKNATPEDLENLANFMKDMNKEYGFTDDLPEDAADEDAPPTLESIKQIAQNLRGVKIGGEDGEKFAGLIRDLTGDEDFQDEMTKVRGQIVDLKASSGQLMETFRGAGLEGMKRELKSATGGNGGNSLNPVVPADDDQVDYYIPVNYFSDFPEQPAEKQPTKIVAQSEVTTESQEETSDHFPASELSNSLTDDYVLRVPKSPEERSRWVEVANNIRIGAWFEGTGGTNQGTVFIDGIAFRSGETIERQHQGEQYLFRFEGIQEGQVIITSLKRESGQTANAPD